MKMIIDLPKEKVEAWVLCGIPTFLSFQDKELIGNAIADGIILNDRTVVVKDMQLPESCRYCPINVNGECNFVMKTDFLRRPMACPLRGVEEMCDKELHEKAIKKILEQQRNAEENKSITE